jgi:exopolysaccharide biosynthesis protein
MWLVVVDGRQERYSEGMTLQEMGDLMRGLGCWRATNMDGGGSSVMGLAEAGEHLRVVNSPSDRSSGALRVRPLPAILTIRRTPCAR